MIYRAAFVGCALLLIAVALIISTRLIFPGEPALPTSNTTYTEGAGPTVGALIIGWGPPIDAFTDASDRDLVWSFAEVDISQNGLSPFTRIQQVLFTSEHGFWGWRGFTYKTR